MALFFRLEPEWVPAPLILLKSPSIERGFIIFTIFGS
jgi:hypothetical protein